MKRTMNKLSDDFFYYQHSGRTSNDSEIHKRLNDLSSKLAESPVILIDKRTKITNENNDKSNLGKDARLKQRPLLKNSPSYLMFLMKSFSSKTKSNSFIHFKKPQPHKNDSLTDDRNEAKNSEKESLKTRNREKRAQIYKRILGSLRSSSASSITFENDSDRSSFLDLKIEPDKINTIRTNHYDSLFETISNNHLKSSHTRIASDCPGNTLSYVDPNIFDDFMQKVQINQQHTNARQQCAQNSRSTVNSDINTDAVELIFNLAKDLVFLSILLIIIWPITILLKLFLLVNGYLSNVFANLDDVNDQIEAWNTKISQLEEKILDKIRFFD